MGLANMKRRTLPSRTLVGIHPVADQFPLIELLIQSKGGLHVSVGDRGSTCTGGTTAQPAGGPAQS